MKHLGDAERELTTELLTELGVAMEPNQLSQILRHLDWLLETSLTLNLTAVKQPVAAVRLHIVDSLSALPEVNDAPDGLLIDLGTGGGFPGVELALASGRNALLVDSVKKKCAALSAFLVHESLESRISVSALRAEELTAAGVEPAAVVTARALSELPALVELASPLLATGGRLVALKARAEDSEIVRGRAAAAQCGMQEHSIRRMVLPGGDEVRTIVTYAKVRKSVIPLPRRVGLAQTKPLA